MLKIKGARSFKKMSFYPFLCKNKFDKSRGKFKALLGLGSNIDGEKERFIKFFRLLMADKRFKVLQTSSILINKAFGYEAQKDFHNAVMLLQSNLHARALLKILLFYEFKFRRKRSFKNAPRTLDLDLLYFSAKSKNDYFCTLPHVGVNERLSVILPLAELNLG